MKGDGHCLFHCFAHFLDRKSGWKGVRQEIVSWMKETKDDPVYQEGDVLTSLSELLKLDNGPNGQPKEV